MSALPFRATGGNVLLRKVALDIHRGLLTILNNNGAAVVQVGEVVGLGGRWTQERAWQPPMPVVKPLLLDDGSPDPNWVPPDLSNAPRPHPARFNQGHVNQLGSLEVGDLVLFTQSRVYDVFNWKGEDILVYPGNWIHGKVEGSSIDNPSVRRYLLDSFDTEAPDRKRHG